MSTVLGLLSKFCGSLTHKLEWESLQDPEDHKVEILGHSNPILSNFFIKFLKNNFKLSLIDI